jgi:hypothetical protein
MININPSFFHNFFKVAIRNAIPDIKENRIKNNVLGNRRVILPHEILGTPVAYCGLKIITSLSLRFPDFQRIVERADVVDVGESHGQESERKATLIRYFAEGLATVHYRCTLNVPPEQYYYCSPCITCPLTLTIRL